VQKIKCAVRAFVQHKENTRLNAKTKLHTRNSAREEGEENRIKEGYQGKVGKRLLVQRNPEHSSHLKTRTSHRQGLHLEYCKINSRRTEKEGGKKGPKWERGKKKIHDKEPRASLRSAPDKTEMICQSNLQDR